MKRIAFAAAMLVWCYPLLVSMNSSPQEKPGCVITEYGKAEIDFGKDEEAASKFILFKHKYRRPPLVIASECGTRGAYTFIKAEDFSETRFRLTAKMVGKSWGYRCDVAYIVIGEIVK